MSDGVWDLKNTEAFDVKEIGKGSEACIIYRDTKGAWTNTLVETADPYPEDLAGFENLAKVLETLEPESLVLMVAANHYETAIFVGTRENLLDFGVFAAGENDIEGEPAREKLDRTGSVGYDEAYLALTTASEMLRVVKLRRKSE